MGEIVGFILVLLGGLMVGWVLLLGAISAVRFFLGRLAAERRELEVRKRVTEMMRKATDNKKKK